MKFNPDCMRDVLFYLEENLKISSDLKFKSLSIYNLAQDLSYPREEIANMLILLDEGGYIKTSVLYANNAISILDVSRITFSGYQFIESVRPERVWTKVKNVCSDVGSFSMSVISQVSSSILILFATGALNL